MPARPMRVKFKSELGISTTLPTGEQHLHVRGQGRDTLVTCPGPDPVLCVPLADRGGRVLVLRVPEFDGQMPPDWEAAIPSSWTPVNVAEASALLPGTRVVHYAPATRLLPSVYAPLLARLRLQSVPEPARTVWLPATDTTLVVPELALAAAALGLGHRRLSAQVTPQDLARTLTRERPALFLSLNFHGLDPYGENVALLREAGVPTAVWCVDNPLHLLTNQKNTLWKTLPLFVTDDWFVPVLQSLGSDARHLPLATSEAFFGPRGICPGNRDLTFVGRSSFPDRDRFFAASRVPDDLTRAAQRLSGRQAHFGWWRERLPDVPLWPGNAVRTLGLGAEIVSVAWRRNCLTALARDTDLTVVGDEAWRDLVPGARLAPPVDYYSGLAAIYRAASFSLNLTSLLLPHGLTQRHFDVWACGGFLLTDATPGLAIFPQDLARAVSFDTPAGACALLNDLAGHSGRKEDLRRAWQTLILAEHTYAHRLATILEMVARP